MTVFCTRSSNHHVLLIKQSDCLAVFTYPCSKVSIVSMFQNYLIEDELQIFAEDCIWKCLSIKAGEKNKRGFKQDLKRLMVCYVFQLKPFKVTFLALKFSFGFKKLIQFAFFAKNTTYFCERLLQLKAVTEFAIFIALFISCVEVFFVLIINRFQAFMKKKQHLPLKWLANAR